MCQEPKVKSQSRSGQTLIETVIALSMLTVGLLGIITLLSQSLGLSRSVSENYLASYLSAEAIEVVKNIIDMNRINGLEWDSNLGDGIYEVTYNSTSLMLNQNRFLRYDPTTNLYGYDGSRTTPFRRTVTIAHISNDELQVVARTTWTTRGGGSFETVLEDHFFNWR